MNEALRRQFERHYLTHPARRQRVELAKVLLAKLDQAPSSPTFDREIPPRRSSPAFWQSLFSHFPVPALATILMLMLGGGWLFYKTVQLQNALNEQRASRTRAEQQLNELQQRNEQLSAELERLQTPPDLIQPTPSPDSLASIVTLLLPASQMMSASPGSATPTLTLTPGVKLAQLQFNLTPSDYSRYRAVLQTADGKTIHEQSNVSPRRRQTTALFTISIPANKLASGEYILTLSGVNADGETDTLAKSIFRVWKK